MRREAFDHPDGDFDLVRLEGVRAPSLPGADRAGQIIAEASKLNVLMITTLRLLP
jgi:hypothetical protein